MRRCIKLNRVTHQFLSHNEINLQIIELIQQVFLAFATVHVVRRCSLTL